MHSKTVLSLDACGEDVASLVGGKALGLGALLRSGLAVPPGFVVTTAAYRAAIKEAGISDRIDGILASADPAGDLAAASAEIAALFVDELITSELRDAVEKGYAELGMSKPVAVRSSAIAEDRADASFAGQQDTFLWVCGSDAVLSHIVRCWASLFSPRVIAYRARLQVPAEDVAMAVVVQEMVPARAAGVMMTLDPANGDRSTVYVESAYGLGEAVVAGEVTPDAFWVEKDSLTLRRRVVGDKQVAYRFDEEIQGVSKVDVPAEEGARWSLELDEVRQLAQLGKDIERAFGQPMDVEWAVVGSGSSSAIHLLQARPETVWASQPEPDLTSAGVAAEPAPIDPDPMDPLHSPTAPDTYWSTSNFGEAMPGVLTPLSWTLWHRVVETGARRAVYRLGVLSRSESELSSDVTTHYIRAFYGRPAIQLGYLGMIGDRMPGTTSEEAVEGVLGRVPDDWQAQPTRRRWPFILVRLPWTFATVAREIRATVDAVDAWYHPHLQRVESAVTLDDAMQTFRSAADHFDRAVATQVIGTLGGIMPVYQALERAAKSVDGVDLSALSGFGGAEVSGLVTDVWLASRGELSEDDVLAMHGFHGPMEGEMSSAVWREEPEPLRSLIATYGGQPDENDPRLREAGHQMAFEIAKKHLLTSTPRRQRPAMRLLLKLAAARIPLRGAAKQSLLQGLDGARASARRIGTLLREEGRLDRTDDVFYLTEAELRGAQHSREDLKALVASRRARRDAYLDLSIPGDWRGVPRPYRLPRTDGSGGEGDATMIEGIGVSSGIVEGVARVLHTPDFSQVRAGDILVTPTTDPSWSSVMFISSALVVDIGGALSHAAVVARELRVPCVVNTRVGTRTIRTGDRLRVDGTSGTVEILERSVAPEASHAASDSNPVNTNHGGNRGK